MSNAFPEYQEKRKYLQYDDVLEKPYQLGEDEMSKARQECNLPDELLQRLIRISGRIELHLLRLLRRSDTERIFAIAFLKHFDVSEKKVFERARMVINSEGCDTKMFWTLSPYLHKAMIEKGIQDQESIQKLLLWASGGVSLITEINKPRGVKRESEDIAHLRGLEDLEREWVLSRDVEHVSHRYTEEYARRVAEIL